MPSDTDDSPPTLKASDTAADTTRETAVTRVRESTLRLLAVTLPYEFYNNAQFSDFIIHYGKGHRRTFFAHKIILASRSTWFKSAFTGPLPADWVGDTYSVTLDEHIADVEPMLDWIYQKPRRDLSKLDVPDLLDLYQMADKYGVAEFGTCIGDALEMGLEYFVTGELCAAMDACEDRNEVTELFEKVVSRLYLLRPGTVSERLRAKLIVTLRESKEIGYTAPNDTFDGPMAWVLLQPRGCLPRFYADFLGYQLTPRLEDATTGHVIMHGLEEPEIFRKPDRGKSAHGKE